jgi:peptidoglycan/xylan/chitin deacetylase (PgdA/CDA1 family)
MAHDSFLRVGRSLLMSAKIRIRTSAAQLLFLTGLTASKRRSRGQLAIVTFHRVLTQAERQAYPYPKLVVTPSELDAFLTYFTKHFDCGSLVTQHERYMNEGNSARPLLALTFDDAPYDNYLNARPVLDLHRVKVSFFAPVVAVERQELLWHDRLGYAVLGLLKRGDGGRERLMRVLATAGLSGSGPNSLAENAVQAAKGLALEARLRLVEALAAASGTARAPEFARVMTFEELAELGADGHEIGSHSMTHCMMPECDDAALTYELSESRRVLQARTGQPVDTFCYPDGLSDARTVNAVATAGYRRAVTTIWGHNGRDADRFQLRRCNMGAEQVRDSCGGVVPAVVALRMSGFYPGLG